MQRIRMIVLLLLCMLLSACSQASQVENHAYVLVMGLDILPDGRLQMTVQVPKIAGGSGQASGEGTPQDNYTQFTVTADDYESALARLNWASPRDLTLSQIKLIVLSRVTAEDVRCRELIENIAQTERLYTAARVAVCEGKASDFVKAIQPNIGTHISMDIEAMYEHYTGSGYIPASSLAELYYQTESIYSDPMVTYAILNPSSKPAAALSGSLQQISSEFESDIEARYLGAAVFADGKMCGTFTGEECIMANLIRNEIEAIRYECGGQTLDVVPARAAFVSVDVSGERPRIRINAHLAIAAQEKRPDEEKLRSSFEHDIRETISRAQDMGAEPFGFAEKAARHFLTIDDWLAYNWRDQFKNAEIEVELHFSSSDA